MSARRPLEFAAAAALLTLTAPASLVAATAIQLTDGGPVLFRQLRLGRDRVPFILLKFRSMRDGRVTPVGAVLRELGWDELPQLVNLLRGELALIGPRPLTPEDVARLELDHPELGDRFTVRPGITGLIQVLGTRGAPFSVAVENAYAARATAAQDAQILALTVGAALLGKDRLRSIVGHFPTWKSRLLYL
ncbi:MAG TPA: sugar transferase [Polyangiaceae bacterium]|jgi:lipopolysaccharide/colanic/teichoic acid biosynthesis glycosyltransferase|nr:MAG: putative sugar transferase EpsL [Deltaproteobacteria bacterium ADurb.Bin207]HNZ23465.1 sugar transferase [Polyangiaceae bacterium]HOH01236.1 sugar transferase [Polyangiaceae bacterium]